MVGDSPPSQNPGYQDGLVARLTFKKQSVMKASNFFNGNADLPTVSEFLGKIDPNSEVETKDGWTKLTSTDGVVVYALSNTGPAIAADPEAYRVVHSTRHGVNMIVPKRGQFEAF